MERLGRRGMDGAGALEGVGSGWESSVQQLDGSCDWVMEGGGSEESRSRARKGRRRLSRSAGRLAVLTPAPSRLSCFNARIAGSTPGLLALQTGGPRVRVLCRKYGPQYSGCRATQF